jgi:hypothetical protein
MLKQHTKKILTHFWTSDSGLTSMLVLLCLLNFFIVPVFDRNKMVHILTNIAWVLLLLAGIVALAKNTRQLLLFSILPVCHSITRWTLFFHESPPVTYANFIFEVLTSALFITLVMIKVFQAGPEKSHRIVGAVLGYLLIANLWSVMYNFLYIQLPGSFNVSFPVSDYNNVNAQFLYFSYTTLTTTGFGDILPLHRFVRTLVIIEQIIGVLYPVVLIGRLVSLKGEHSRKP